MITKSPPSQDHRAAREALSWTGFAANDVNGRRVGTMAGAVVDRITGDLQWLLIELAGVRRRVVVPSKGVVAGASHLMIPHQAGLIRGLPAAPEDGAMTPRAEQLAGEPFGGPPTRPPAVWERRRVTALAFLDEFNEVLWNPPPRDGIHRFAARGLRVVIVEDNPGYCALLSEWLRERGGIEVEAIAHSADDGIAAIRRRRPDVAIVDLVLPGGSGLELAESLRRDVPTRFLMLSGHEDMAPLVRHRLAGRGSFLPKSAGAAAILTALESRAFGPA